MRHAICYVSSANSDLSQQQIKVLFNFCKEQNEQKDIKGILLYSEGNFFQIMEGEKDTVLAVFKKIEQDPRHYGLIKIMGKDITHGSCDGYKVDILKGAHKKGYEIPQEYLVPLQGISAEAKKPMERILKMFVSTR